MILILRASHKAKLTQGGERVLVLGAGYVSAPAVEYLTRTSSTSVTLGLVFFVLVSNNLIPALMSWMLNPLGLEMCHLNKIYFFFFKLLKK